MAVNSKVNISLENLPVGSLLGHLYINPDTQNIPVELLNLLFENKELISTTLERNIISTQYPNFFSKVSTTNAQRIGFGFDGTDFHIIERNGCLSQTTTDGSSFTNNMLIENSYAFTTIQGAQNQFYSDYSNGKSVWCNQYLGRFYVYTDDFTNYHLVRSSITSGYYNRFRSPIIAGSTYSFFDATNNKRVYTTDHTIFSDCTGFGTTDLVVHTMSNGDLYTHSGTTLRVSTNDGINWTNYTLPVGTNNSGNHCLDFDGTTYVYGSSALYSSTDLNSWTLRTSNIAGATVLHRVWFVNSVWFVFSATSTTTSFSTSTDGITWTNRTSPNAIICNCVIYINSLFLILGTDRVITSPTLVTWTSSITVSGATSNDIYYRSFFGSGNKCLFVQENGISYFYNAGSWTTVTSGQQISGLRRFAPPSLTGVFVKTT